MADGKVDGTSGADTIVSGYGDADGDSVGVGPDLIFGYGGADSVDGWFGNDTIYGGSGDDTLKGGNGMAADLIYGGDGNDSFWGQAGSDTLYGGTGQDTLEGDSGDDVLYSDSGDDDVYGGTGNDYIYVVEGTSAYIEGNSGDDTIDFNPLTGTTISSVNYYGGSTTDGYVMFANGERLEFRSMDTFLGIGDGTVDGTAGNDSMGAGYDDGGDDIIGDADGLDDDVVMGYGGTDTIATGTGDDTLYGGISNDTLYGGSGDDAIYGDSGDDYLVGGDGGDTLYSSAGNDTYDGGTGQDFIDFGSETGGVSVDLNGGGIGGAAAGDVISAGVDGIYGTDFDDTISGFDPFSLSGDAYTNIFYGRAGNDILNGRGGPDELYGGSGDDTFTMTADPGNDTIVGGEGGSDEDVIDFSGTAGPVTVAFSGTEAGTVVYGTDTVSFSEVETIQLTDSADTVTGGAGAETILAEGGNDAISMNGGGDSVAAGGGADTVYGGAGRDSLAGDSGDDEIYGGSGEDTLSGSYGADTIDGGSGGDAILGGAGGDSLSGGAGADTLFGGTGDDVLDGGAGDDSLQGNTGNDTIYGYGGNDTLYGGAGIDSLIGGSGDDSLFAASGDDEIYGSSGDDYVTLTGMNNYALYGGEDPGDTDFDVLDISALGDLGQVSSIVYDTPDKEDGTIFFTNGDSATFAGFEQIVCFARGTRLLTGNGYRRVESLTEGDLLMTRDNGLQPILWIGRRRVTANEANAPVVVPEGTMGAIRPLRVSPQHRLLVAGWQAEVLFGEAEVLVPAKHLVDGSRIRSCAGGEVVYFHVCMAQHEILTADGVPAESFLPGDIGAAALPADQLERLYAALPRLRDDIDAMRPARPLLRGFEAQALRGAMTARAAASAQPETA